MTRIEDNNDITKAQIVRRDENGDRIAVINSYAPGDGDLSFVARNPQTSAAISPGPTEEECKAACPYGWILYADGPNWRARKVYEQNNCDGSGPHTTGEVRVMPTGGDGNLILCRQCWENELHYRRDRNRSLAVFAQFDIIAWNDAKVYETV